MSYKSGSIFWSVFYKYETKTLRNDSIMPKGNNIVIILDKWGVEGTLVYDTRKSRQNLGSGQSSLFIFFSHIIYIPTVFAYLICTQININKHFKTLNLNFNQDSHQIWYSMYISRCILLSKNKVFKRRRTYDVLLCMYIPVIWIRTDNMRFRIHKIWWIWIRIQVNKIPKLILKLRKKCFFLQICTLDAHFFGMNLQSSWNFSVYVVSYYIK